MSTREAIVAEAITWLRTPYHHRQRVKGAGVDCAQILIGVYSAVGLIDDFDPGEYPRDWMLHQDDERFRRFVEAHADPITRADLLPGDAALYQVGRCFAHGAIVIDWPLVVHADSKFGWVTLAEGDSGWLAERDVLFFRVKGLQ